MEGVEGTARVRISLDSIDVHFNGHATPNAVASAQKVSEPQKFEWVQHGDASARRRARAHVTRGFRRQKAEQAQLAKAKCERKSPSPPSGEPDVTAIYKTSSPVVQPSEEDDAKSTIQDIVLLGTLGSGRTDPFTSLPVKLNAGTQALLDHCGFFFPALKAISNCCRVQVVFGVAPVSFSLDSSSDFNPVKTLSFKIALVDPSAFHVLLAAGASDIAALHGKQDSEDAIRHRGMSITLVNNYLSQGDSSDRALTAVSLLAGNELLFGRPQGYNTHMTGLDVLLRLRGGLETLQETNPPLYSWISWIDYAGSCNLASRRRFANTGPIANPSISDPAGVPEELIRSVPASYDLFEHMTIAFRRFEIMVSLVRTGETKGQQVHEVTKFLSHIDGELYRSICRPDILGNRSRRQYIQQSFHLFTLMHAAMVSSSGGSDADHFLERLETVFKGELKLFGTILADLCRVCVAGIEINANTLNIRISMMVDACAALGWEEWHGIKKALLRLFLTEEICAGQLQIIWRHRIENSSVSFNI